MTTQIRIDTEAIIGSITPHLTGACLEDVNHEVYGGIFSQMVFGESFEEEPMAIDARLDAAFEGLTGTVSCLAQREHLKGESEVRSWQPFGKGGAQGSFRLCSSHARRGQHCQEMHFEAGQGEVGIENRGLNRWGMNFQAGRDYEGTAVLRSDPRADQEATSTEVVIALESADGGVMYAETTLDVPQDGKWHVLNFLLSPAADDAQGRLAIKLQAPGNVAADYVALHPGQWGRFEGLPVRKDIADALIDQGLTVLRYGGFMINTRWLEERGVGPVYRWKDMIGPRHDRPPYWGTFYRYNSNGFGIIDFIAMCNAANFLAVPTISSLESDQDIADFVEYVNGGIDTEWGAHRAADGHAEPFGLEYIAIGNEEWNEEYVEEFGRLSDVIAKADPEITCIVAMWMLPNTMEGEESSRMLRELIAHSRGKKVLWDLHVGGDNFADGDFAEKLFVQARQFIDEADPHNEILFCILEENGSRHDVQRALSHAHIINTAERFGDELLIDCPANCLQPWLQNDNDWNQGQVFFTPSAVWGQPPFYAQQMIARNYLPVCIRAEFDSDALDITATRSEDGGALALKVVNMTADPVPATVTFAGDGFAATSISVETLTGDLTAENTPDAPENITPVCSTIEPPTGGELTHTFPGHSFTVLRFLCD